jgi:hypothetical protein
MTCEWGSMTGCCVVIGRCRPAARNLANRENGVPRSVARFVLNAIRSAPGAALTRVRDPGNDRETLQSFPKPFDRLRASGWLRLTWRRCCIMCKTPLRSPANARETVQCFPKLPPVTLRLCCIMCKTHLGGPEYVGGTRLSFPKLRSSRKPWARLSRRQSDIGNGPEGRWVVSP